ncbi:nucleotide exchange factor GrpE [bacterium]|nr:nucleotide exchange factor GrpE [bacterium]
MKKPDKKHKKVLTPADYEQQIGELTEHLQRLQAEFENYKKRAASERAEMMDMAKVSVLTELLPALDNFDRAAAHLPEELADNNWAKGMQYVGQQIWDIFENIGVHKFQSLGEHFDPQRHEALEYIQSDQPADTVVEELTPGYEINGRVVRPATVKVSKNSNDENNEGENL